jgi:murein DD-endopeptidase MepM/ murein hydrolase activator NlpD
LQPSTTYRIEVRVKDRNGNYSSWRATTGRTRPRPESSGGGWTHPHPGAYSSSCYGPRWGSFHAGVDLVRSHRASVKSAHSGTVVQVGWNGGYGRSVVVNHGRYYTLYGHLDSVTVRTGQSVRAGQEVGKQGTTGDSTGSHLHFEVWDNGWYRRTNPASFMRNRGIRLGSCG